MTHARDMAPCSGRRPGAAGSAGFTLIELVITVVIIGILASIAIPSYISHIRHGRRTDAKTALQDLAAREERFYTINNTYSVLPSDLGYGAVGSTFPMAVGNGYYTVSVATTVGPPATYTITATPIAGKGQDKDPYCASFTATQTGSQTALNAGGADNTAVCWTQ